MKVGVIVVTYNQPSLLVRQCELIKKYCKDDYTIVVVDNSTDDQAIRDIKYHAKNQNCEYMKTIPQCTDGSRSHAFAANSSYGVYKNRFDLFFYLDHDCFPIKEFSVVNVLHGNSIAGIGQQKRKKYLWAGCVMFFRDDLIDFSVMEGLDTGGGLHKMIDKYDEWGQVIYFDETYEESGFKTDSIYSKYSLINKGMFMHFINGSNWNAIENNEGRINSLLNILEEKTR